MLPRINPKLNIIDPMTFPIDMSVCFVTAALIVTANSGAEVPNATTVRPIIKSDTLGHSYFCRGVNKPISSFPKHYD